MPFRFAVGFLIGLASVAGFLFLDSALAVPEFESATVLYSRGCSDTPATCPVERAKQSHYCRVVVELADETRVEVSCPAWAGLRAGEIVGVTYSRCRWTDSRFGFRLVIP